ncbi:MAG: VCBS repeat-containing protein, partial [Isosphaeraceae bacterium]
MRGASGWIAIIVLGLAVPGGQAAGDEPRLAEYFGFQPLEIYKLDNRISGLLVRDLDGDKVDDVAVINNARSRIDLLLSGKGPAADDTLRNEANQVPSDRRMRLKGLPVNKEVVSLQAGDFNGDGRLDLAYYGTPAELIVLLNQGEGRFGAPIRKTVGEAVESGTALAVGDLNRDGRDDLALLTSGNLVLILQTADGKLGEPERLPHACSNPRMLRAVDLDGDGGDDLVILDGGDDDPIRVRFSVEGGTPGPEQRFQVEPLRALSFADLDGKPGAEILTIESQSGRVKVLTLDDGAEEETDRRGRLVVFPLPKGDTRGRSTALGDLDGDGKTDVVVTDPAAAEVLVYLQKKDGLAVAQTFPGLVGGKAVQVADLDGDGKGEVIVLSEAEKQIGLSRMNDGRLSFPTPLPISGEPVTLDVADLDGDKQPEVLYLTKGRDGSETFDLRALKQEKSGTFVPFRWGPDDAVAVKGLSGNPPALRVLDANRDNLADVLIFNAFGSPVLLLGRPGGEPPAPAGGSLGPLAGVAPAGLSLVGPDGPALIVAQNGYARNLVLDKDSGQWQIKDQYNAGRPSAQIVAASVVDLDGDDKAEIALFD